MWPLTWAADDNLYAAAGDNSGIPGTTLTPMNVYVVRGAPGQNLALKEINH